MLLPIVSKVVLPTLLNGAENGRLNDAILEEIQPGIWLERDAAASFLEMRDAAHADGVDLVIDYGYRDFATQKSIFLSRYVTEYLTGHETVVWNNQRYWKLAGVATAAVPGSSNHGWGLAVDLVASPGVVDWMCAHGGEHGWSAELQTEDWHWRRHAGNYNAPPAEDDEMGKATWRILVPAGSAAKFIAPMIEMPDGALAAISATWLPTGPAVDAYRAHGVEFLELGIEDLRNVVLIGPLPVNDARQWTTADFLAVA